MTDLAPMPEPLHGSGVRRFTLTEQHNDKKMHAWSLAALPLAIGLASFSGAANAVNFNIGDIEAQFDSQLSVGASWAMENADKRFIDYRTVNPNTGANLGGSAVARTSDDGRLNYKKGDAFSKIFRGVHDLELKYGDSGAFLRGKYWYDFEPRTAASVSMTSATRGVRVWSRVPA